MTIEELIDRQIVQETSLRFAHYCDRQELEPLLDLFTDDAVFDESAAGLPVSRGKRELRDFFSVALPRNGSMFHLQTNYIIDFIGQDRARATYWLYFEGSRFSSPNITRKIKAHVEDVLVRQDGRWLISSKTLRTFAPVQWSSSWDTTDPT
jgi:hypothetical protein